MVEALSFWGLSGPVAYLLVASAVVGAFAAIFAAVRSMVRWFRKVAQGISRWFGEDDTGKGGVLDTQKQILGRLDQQDDVLAHLLHEIPPNGVPLRADVDAIKEAVQLIQAAQKVTDMNVADLRKSQRRHGQDHRRMEAHWIAALRAQGIDTPEPRP
jgi:hypothetical protein